ncbi:MAG TPA: hypothetical protein VIT83_03130 [Gammaproteobacteria bacterium]
MDANPELVAQIVNDIHTIKWVLAIIGIFVAVATISIALGLYFISNMAGAVADRIEETTRSKFSEDAARLFEEDRLDDLVELAETKIRERPNHTYAHWYLAKALFKKGLIHDAKREFETVRNLNPPWSVDHVEPYIEELELRIRNSRPELVD